MFDLRLFSRDWKLLSLVLLTWTLSVAVPANAAEQRVALVIGNSAYKVSPLANPVNDAKDVATALRSLGFSVTLKENANQKVMKQIIRDFGNELRKGGVGLFYFAGHGVQYRGRNFLIPVGTDIQSEDELEDQSVDTNLVLEKMDYAQNRVNVVILDACRNNPFARSFRSATRGLAQMDAAKGTLIAYSTAPGQVALDGTGRNSPYAKYLLSSLKDPESDVEKVFKRVRAAVVQETSGKQTPWESSSLIGDFYFSAGAAPVAAQPAVTSTIQQVDPVAVEMAFWDSIKSSSDLADFQAYLKKYPNGQFADLAKNRAEQLKPDIKPEKPATVALAAPSTQAPTSRPADEARRSLLRLPIDGKFGFVDTAGRWVIEPKFDSSWEFDESGLAAVRVGDEKTGKWGFIDTKGRWVIEPKFDSARPFDKLGLAAVQLGIKWGYIDTRGQWKIEPKFGAADPFDESGLAAAATRGEWGLFDGKLGYIDAAGRWVIEPKFDIAPFLSSGSTSFNKTGLAAVSLGGKYGYIDTKAHWVIEPKFDFADAFGQSGLARVRFAGKWGFIDTKGRWVIEAKFDYAYSFDQSGLATVSLAGKYGYIDTKGHWVIEAKFNAASPFGQSGFAAVRIGDDKTGKWGYIDTGGRWVAEPKFDTADSFQDSGLALVGVGNYPKFKYGYIDTAGRWVVKPR